MNEEWYKVVDDVLIRNEDDDYYHKLGDVYLPEGIREIYSEAFVAIEADSIIIPEGVERIDDYAFSGSANIQKLVIPSTVNFISELAFVDLRGIDNIEVSEDNEHFKSVDGVLYNKALTTLIKVPNKFNSLPFNVKTFVILKSLDTISPNAFSGIGDIIIKIEESNNNFIIKHDILMDTNEKIAIKVSYIKALEEYEKAYSMISLPTTTKVVCNNAFYNNSQIDEFVFNDGLKKIGDYAFKGCKKLSVVNLGENIKEIGISAFENISFLETLTLKGHQKTFGGYCFKDSENIEDLYISSIDDLLSYEFKNPKSIPIIQAKRISIKKPINM